MKVIVAAIDFSNHSRTVIEKAVQMAQAFDANLEVLHVVAPEPDFVGYTEFTYPGRDERADELHQEKDSLRKLLDGLKKDGLKVRAFMKEAPTAKGIVEFSEKHNASFIVMGTHSRGGLKRFFLGSTANDVLKLSTIPVTVVPPAEKD